MPIYRVNAQKEIVGTVNELPAFKKVIGIDTETTGLNPWINRLLSVQISDGNDAYVLTDGFERVRPYLEDADYLKIFHYTYFDTSWLRVWLGATTRRTFDTMIAQRVLRNGLNEPADLATLAEKYLSITLEKDTRRPLLFTDFTGEMSVEQIGYAGKDAIHLPALYTILSGLLKTDGLIPTAKLEFDLSPVLANMHVRGIGFDARKWKAVKSDARALRGEKLVELLQYFPHVHHEIDLFGDVRSDFNPASPTQLTKAFNKIGVDVEDVSEKTLKKYLRDNSNDEVFRKLFSTLLEYRTANSLANLDLESHINPKTGRIHTQFNQLGARTGRLSSNDPNLQNQRATDELRSVFIAGEGLMLADIDLSQIELVTMAELSGDKEMMAAVLNGEDLHSAAARLLFGTTTPTKQQRQIAKGCNFAAVFCASADTFSVTAGIPFADAEMYLELYHQKFPRIREFSAEQVALSVDRGYSLNAGGRRRYIDKDGIEPEIKQILARNPRMKREWAERQAVGNKFRAMLTNNPVQSTAADIIKKSLVDIDTLLTGNNSHLILTVHDEIIIEGPEYELQELAPKARAAMEAAGSAYLKQLPVKAVLAPLSPCWKK